MLQPSIFIFCKTALSRRQLGAPDPKFLAVSAAIGNILHLTGRGTIIENLIEDFDDAVLFWPTMGVLILKLFFQLADFRFGVLVEMQLIESSSECVMELRDLSLLTKQ